MGYSRSVKTLEKRMPLLTNLMKGNETSWKCSEGHERTLAYQIREALHIARTVVPKDYPKLATAAEEFEIKEVGPGLVIARRRPEPKVTTTQERMVATFDLLSSFDPNELTATYFPNTNLTEKEIKTLAKRLREKYNWLLFLDEDSNSITLKPFDAEIEEFAVEGEG